MIEDPEMEERWYVLRSKARKEEVLCRQARLRGFEVFYPRLRVNPVNPRARRVRPYFPSYMFVWTDPAVVGVVPSDVVSALQRRVDDVNRSGDPFGRRLKSGDPIRITGGPFEGYGGLFDVALPGRERVRVLMSLLNGRAAPLELHRQYVERQSRTEGSD
jgi:transcriptional antiterminator RfaH